MLCRPQCPLWHPSKTPCAPAPAWKGGAPAAAAVATGALAAMAKRLCHAARDPPMPRRRHGRGGPIRRAGGQQLRAAITSAVLLCCSGVSGSASPRAATPMGPTVGVAAFYHLPQLCRARGASRGGRQHQLCCAAHNARSGTPQRPPAPLPLPGRAEPPASARSLPLLPVPRWRAAARA